MMIDLKAANMNHHRSNIRRYCRLLATQLTDLERQYLHRRIAEEQAELDRLERQCSRASQNAQTAGAGAPNRSRSNDTNLALG
jgi:hypothetical protein